MSLKGHFTCILYNALNNVEDDYGELKTGNTFFYDISKYHDLILIKDYKDILLKNVAYILFY